MNDECEQNEHNVKNFEYWNQNENKLMIAFEFLCKQANKQLNDDSSKTNETQCGKSSAYLTLVFKSSTSIPWANYIFWLLCAVVIAVVLITIKHNVPLPMPLPHR